VVRNPGTNTGNEWSGTPWSAGISREAKGHSLTIQTMPGQRVEDCALELEMFDTGLDGKEQTTDFLGKGKGAIPIFPYSLDGCCDMFCPVMLLCCAVRVYVCAFYAYFISLSSVCCRHLCQNVNNCTYLTTLTHLSRLLINPSPPPFPSLSMAHALQAL
jgi:hypothetical protein